MKRSDACWTLARYYSTVLYNRRAKRQKIDTNKALSIIMHIVSYNKIVKYYMPCILKPIANEHFQGNIWIKDMKIHVCVHTNYK